MDDAEATLQRVQLGARSGARSVVRASAIVQDAVLEVLSRWENAMLARKRIQNVHGWAFRVAANAARRLLADRRWTQLRGHEVAPEPDGNEEPTLGASRRKTLRMQLGRARGKLRGRQLEVIRKMLEDGMSYRRAARELGMTPGNVRRSFRSGLARLERGLRQPASKQRPHDY